MVRARDGQIVKEHSHLSMPMDEWSLMHFNAVGASPQSLFKGFPMSRLGLSYGGKRLGALVKGKGNGFSTRGD